MTFSFRRVEASDLPMLKEWLERPHVAERWPPPSGGWTAEAVRADFLEDTEKAPYVACADGQPVGYIQSYVPMDCTGGWWPDETDPGARGVDQFLADPEMLNRGLGTAMIRGFVDLLFEDPAVTKIQTDPRSDNPRAIRCYEKVGFRRVEIVDTPEGPALYMVIERAGYQANATRNATC